MKEQLLEVWYSRTFQIAMDICRILLVIIAAMIFYKLVTEIEAVKILNNDPCKICMNKTGATCFYQWQVDKNIKSQEKLDKLVNLSQNLNLSVFIKPIE